MPPRDRDCFPGYRWALYRMGIQGGCSDRALITSGLEGSTPEQALERYAEGNTGPHGHLGDPTCNTYVLVKQLTRGTIVNGHDCIAILNLEVECADEKPTVKTHLCSSDPGGIKAESLYLRDLVLDEGQIRENITRLNNAMDRLRCQAPPTPKYRAVAV